MAEKLSTPQNVKISSDGKLTFNAVPNATSYDILANNTVIGNSEGVNTNMAEKTLKTRIQLRFDTYDKWLENNPILKKGEVAVVQIDTTDPVNKLLPPIMFKVGNGETNVNGEKLRFKDLCWTSALAADVYDWAKANTKPSYNYSEIKNTPTIPSVGNGKITIKQAGSEKGSFTVNQTGDTVIELTDTDTKVTDTDTQYQLVLSGHTLKLQSKAKGGSWADVSGQSFTLPDNNTTYTFAEGATNGAFNVTLSDGTAQSVKVHGLGSAAYTASSDYATAAQGAKADSALQEHQEVKLESGTNNGTLKFTVNGTATNNIAVKGLAAAAYKAVDTTPTANSTNLITSGGVKSYIDTQVTGAVQYLGTVASATELAALTPDSAGDFCRVSTAFGSYHASDVLVCKTIKNGSTAATWDVIHGEANTWAKNTATADGYVTKTGGASNAGKVWKVGTDGAPAWLADTDTNTAHTHTNGVGLIRTGDGGTSGTVDYKVALKSETKNANSALAVPTANANRFYPVEADKDGKLAVTVPWTNTQRTDADINGLIDAKIQTLDVSNISGMGAGKTIKTLTETDGKIAATFQDISITASQVSDLTTAYPGVTKQGTVTSVSAASGSGLKITETASTTPTIDWDDTVTLVFDCGDSSDI